MSYPHWPESLVQFERPGWQVQPQDTRRRRQTDAGPPAFRRRFSGAAKRVTLSLVMTRNEAAVFDRFYEEECRDGVSLFWMPDPSRNRWPLLANDGSPLYDVKGRPVLIAARWLCNWGDETPVETVYAGTDFRKSFSIWVMP